MNKLTIECYLKLVDDLTHEDTIKLTNILSDKLKTYEIMDIGGMHVCFRVRANGENEAIKIALKNVKINYMLYARMYRNFDSEICIICGKNPCNFDHYLDNHVDDKVFIDYLINTKLLREQKYGNFLYSTYVPLLE